MRQTLSVKTAGRSMPSSPAAQARPSRCRSQPRPTVASRRSRLCRSTASRSRRSLVGPSWDSSAIAWTHRTDCSDTGLMFSVRPSPNSLQNYWRHYRYLQESPANAKVSVRQPWYIGRNSVNWPPLRIAQQYQHNLYIVEKYFQCSTIPSPTMRLCLHWFSRFCLPNMPTRAKFRENLNLQQFKVIQGRWFCYQSKAHMRVPVSD